MGSADVAGLRQQTQRRHKHASTRMTAKMTTTRAPKVSLVKPRKRPLDELSSSSALGCCDGLGVTDGAGVGTSDGAPVGMGVLVGAGEMDGAKEQRPGSAGGSSSHNESSTGAPVSSLHCSTQLSVTNQW